MSTNRDKAKANFQVDEFPPKIVGKYMLSTQPNRPLPKRCACGQLAVVIKHNEGICQRCADLENRRRMHGTGRKDKA